MAQRGNTGLSILAVDDGARSGMALAVALKLFGHRPFIANDAGEALKLVENDPASFDLVITNQAMPELSGLDLARRLREKGFAGEFVVLIGDKEEIEEQLCGKLGIAGIMRRPVNGSDPRQWINCIHACREQSWTGEKPPRGPRQSDSTSQTAVKQELKPAPKP